MKKIKAGDFCIKMPEQIELEKIKAENAELKRALESEKIRSDRWWAQAREARENCGWLMSALTTTNHVSLDLAPRPRNAVTKATP